MADCFIKIQLDCSIRVYYFHSHKAQAMLYHKWGKIWWAKLSRIPPNEIFTGKLLWYLMAEALKQCQYTKLVYNINKHLWKNSCGTLKNHENLAQWIFPCLRYSSVSLALTIIWLSAAWIYVCRYKNHVKIYLNSLRPWILHGMHKIVDDLYTFNLPAVLLYLALVAGVTLCLLLLTTCLILEEDDIAGVGAKCCCCSNCFSRCSKCDCNSTSFRSMSSNYIVMWGTIYDMLWIDTFLHYTIRLRILYRKNLLWVLKGGGHAKIFFYKVDNFIYCMIRIWSEPLITLLWCDFMVK